MPDSPPARRGRGRPSGGTTDARERILTSARTLFAERGFDGTSVRAIATAATVDASLIRHYFGDKNGLLVATLHLPVNPLELIPAVLAEGPDGLGERIVRTFLTAWDEHREVFAGMVRTTVSTTDREAPVLHVARTVLLPSLRATLAGAEREVRANLIVAQMLGLALTRYVLRIEPVASASVDTVVRWYAPAVQSVVAG